MTNVPPIPLVCSTPPPIDFAKDDESGGTPSYYDEFEKFEPADNSREQSALSEDSIFIHTAIQHDIKRSGQPDSTYGSNIRYIENNSPPPLEADTFTEINLRDGAVKPVEAFNFSINAVEFPNSTENGNSDKNATLCFADLKLENTRKNRDIGFQSSGSNKDNVNDIIDSSWKRKPKLGQFLEGLYAFENIKEHEINVNRPKLQLDKNSVQYKKETNDGAEESTDISNNRVEVNNCWLNNVTVEDIYDDSSDDEMGISKKGHMICEIEKCEDFFAIHPIATNLSERSVRLQDDIKHIQQNVDPINTMSKTSNEDNSNVSNNENIEKAIEEPSLLKNDVDVEIFDEFQVYKIDLESKLIDNSNRCILQAPIGCFNSDNGNKPDTDDGEFCDFSNAASPVILQTSQNEYDISYPSKAKMQTLCKTNIVDLMKPVLKIMFPVDDDNFSNKIIVDRKLNSSNDNSTIIDFQTIETANALKYQWLNSNMRHSLIKSLGIDSRNILFGENWNANMPRFAANLSFNPLKPIKHQKPMSVHVTDTSQIFVPATDISVTATHCNSIAELTNKDSKMDPHLVTNEVLTNRVLLVMDRSSKNEQYIVNTFGAVGQVNRICTIPEYDKTELSNVSSSIPIVNVEDNANNNIVKSLLSVENNNSNEPEPVPFSLQIGCNENEVVTKSTFTGPLKETHIYTPSISTDEASQSTQRTNISAISKTEPVDFDYEIAATGIIINETVVKQEYRDIEYNPGFGLASTKCTDEGHNANQHDISNKSHESLYDDEFTDFQSMPAATTLNIKEILGCPNMTPGEMILSPAVLLPQTISIEGKKNKIEWGEGGTNAINPDELARIEELYQPQKFMLAKDSNNSIKSSPVKEIQQNSLSISASIAQKEKHFKNDDDDWTEFVSVSPPSNTPSTSTIPQENASIHNMNHLQCEQVQCNEKRTCGNLINDDEWSEFVSNKPVTNTLSNVPTSRALPQFNSAAWQNANFYNNPLSFYHQSKINVVPKPLPTKLENNNNYGTKTNDNQRMPTLKPERESKTELNNQPIHIMQDFAALATHRPITSHHQKKSINSSLIQSGSAKVSPSISLIPDLGFVAPAIPTHIANVNQLPKSYFRMKK